MREIVTLALKDIIPYERNPRKNDAAVDDVAESIRQVGYRQRIVVDENNVILAGHTRWKALQKLGWKEAEVQRELDMTEEQKRKYRLLDNKVAEKSEWDYELLDWELEDLDFEGYDFGFEGYDDDFTESSTPEADKYTDVINIPQYTPTGECPDIADLVDDTKYNQLVEEIEGANLPKEVEKFLKYAAARHLAFNYKVIANYYAHQEADIQKLMEESALVIIDLNDAIANGYAELKQLIDDMIEDEEDEE